MIVNKGSAQDAPKGLTDREQRARMRMYGSSMTFGFKPFNLEDQLAMLGEMVSESVAMHDDARYREMNERATSLPLAAWDAEILREARELHALLSAGATPTTTLTPEQLQRASEIARKLEQNAKAS